MKVMKKSKKVDCYVGDIVSYEDYACLVCEEQGETYPYKLVCLEGVKAGQVIEAFQTLSRIDERSSEVLIKKEKVVVNSEEVEGDAKCPF